MAARLICRSSRVTAYLPNFRAVVRHFRSFSNSDTYPSTNEFEDKEFDKERRSLGQFSPLDKRFPLPGRIGYEKNADFPLPPVSPPNDVIVTNDDKKFRTLDQMISHAEEQTMFDLGEEHALDMLECVAQPCPSILRQDLQELFPSRNMSEGDITVMTISHKTIHDMTSWSDEVEVERESLLEAFVKGATEICEALEGAGFWADFIDPSCGKPYFGDHTNSTLFETDERYMKLGFKIEDLGCCKVITHHLWGTHAYIGSLFTNAPADHPLIVTMVKDDDESNI